MHVIPAFLAACTRWRMVASVSVLLSAHTGSMVRPAALTAACAEGEDLNQVGSEQ